MIDEAYMRRALQLARQGLGRTAPNPAVGAVIVRDGRVVAEGWHRAAGQPHAEAEALARAGTAARGADLYVTLEPCCHHGRTPPCTDRIIAAGIARVIYACGDPDPRVAGRGAAQLKAAGIEVISGVLEAEAKRLNEAYFKHKQTGLPFVTLKLACTLNGKVATRTGDSRWVTGCRAREYVHHLRDQNDAVMVGVGTILSDDPALTTRLPDGRGRDALRVVVDTGARTPATAAVIASESQAGCLVAVGCNAPGERIVALRRAGAEVVVLPQTDRGVDLESLMAELGRRDVMGLLCEGGPRLAGSLIAANLVDKLLLFYAPKLLGDELARDAVVGLNISRMGQALAVQVDEIQRIDDDILIVGSLCSPA